MSSIQQTHRDKFPDELIDHGLVKVPALNDLEIPFDTYKYLEWKADPWKWIIEQVLTVDESDNLIKPFPNFKYLRLILEQYFERKIIVVPKTRRMMLTHLFLSGLLPHQLIFVPNSDNIFVQISEEKAKKNFRKRAKKTLSFLDQRFFFYPEFVEKKNLLASSARNPDNGAELAAIPSGADKCRGDTLTNAIYDEFAFQTHCEENLDAIKPALEGKNCRGAFISSANPGTVFEELTDIKEGSDFKALMEGLSITENELNHLIIKTNYKAHPWKRTPEWYYKERYGTTPDGVPIIGESGVSTHTWLKEYEGQFNFPRGDRAIREFTEELHCAPYQKMFPAGYAGGKLLLGFDFGSRFPCVCFIEKDTRNRAIIHGALMVANERQQPFLERVYNYLNENFDGWQSNFDLYADPSGFKETRGGNADPEAIDLEKFFNKRCKNRKKVVKPYYGIRCIDEQMAIKQGDAMGVIVNPSAGTFINEVGKEEHGIIVKAFLYGYCFKKDKNAKDKGHTDSGLELEKDGFYDHPVDTVRYVFAANWKCRDIRSDEITEARKEAKHQAIMNRSRRRAVRR